MGIWVQLADKIFDKLAQLQIDEPGSRGRYWPQFMGTFMAILISAPVITGQIYSAMRLKSEYQSLWDGLSYYQAHYPVLFPSCLVGVLLLVLVVPSLIVGSLFRSMKLARAWRFFFAFLAVLFLVFLTKRAVT